MNLKQAIRLAIEAIDAECHRLAVNANLYEFYGMESGRQELVKRKRLREARAVLATLAENIQLSLPFTNNGKHGDTEKE